MKKTVGPGTGPAIDLNTQLKKKIKKGGQISWGEAEIAECGREAQNGAEQVIFQEGGPDGGEGRELPVRNSEKTG